MSLFTMPAGDYYVGDPCYVFNKSTWTNYTAVGAGVVQTFNGHKCVSFYTKYGDGLYQDNEGFAYEVDSGTIGMIPVKCMDVSKKEAKKHGRIVRFPVQVLIRISKKEDIIDFGGVVRIDTDPEHIMLMK